MVSKRITLGVRGDVGGFGVGSDLTWSLVGSIQYHVSRQVSVGGGYRALDIDYTQGSGANRSALDVLMHGPLLGAVFRFSSRPQTVRSLRERHTRRKHLPMRLT